MSAGFLFFSSTSSASSGGAAEGRRKVSRPLLNRGRERTGPVRGEKKKRKCRGTVSGAAFFFVVAKGGRKLKPGEGYGGGLTFLEEKAAEPWKNGKTFL